MIHGRMERASDEMSHWAEYDYVVINHDLNQAFGDVRAILAAERLKRERHGSDYPRSCARCRASCSSPLPSG